MPRLGVIEQVAPAPPVAVDACGVQRIDGSIRVPNREARAYWEWNLRNSTSDDGESLCLTEREDIVKQIKVIVCPTDFSKAATKAVDYAEQLAIETGAELILVHAFDIPAEMTIRGQEHPRDKRHEEELKAVLNDSPHAARIQRVLHAGQAGEVICWLAQERKCDLIVMGTHGRTGLRHLLMGSVAEHVLRHARCPVLTIRDRDPNEPPLKQPLVLPIPAPAFM